MTEFLELTTTQILGTDSDNPLNNVYVYRADSALGNPNTYSRGLLNAVFNYQISVDSGTVTFLNSINAVQTNSISNVRVAIRNLYNPVDFVELAWSGGGAIGDQSVPATSALSIRGPRYRTGRNRWRKRFPGIPEGEVSGNTILFGAPFTSAVSDLLETLAAPLIGTADTTTRTYTPVILYSVRVDTPDGPRYRRPLTALEADDLNDVIGNLEVSDQIATQTTRRSTPNYNSL